MLDQSMDVIREFVNNEVNTIRLNNNNETQSRNRTEFYSNDELIKLLESDTLNTERIYEEAQPRTEKTVGNNFEGQNDFNLLKVAQNGVEGLTLEIRESLYSKLNSALSINYKTTSSKQSILTESNISDIAKKIEFSILSIATDVNAYKLSGADRVINIEKQTYNKNVCEALRTEMELSRLRDKMNEDNQLNALSIKAEPILREESEFQDDQSNIELITVDTGNGKSDNISVSWNPTESESEYFSCSPNDHNPIETQQNNDSCILNPNTQDPAINVSDEQKLEVVESTKDEEFQSTSANDIIPICNNTNYVEKTAKFNVLSEMHNNSNDDINLASSNRLSLKKKRKRQAECELEVSTICLPTYDNKENINIFSHSNNISDLCTESYLLNKKHRIMKSETTLNIFDININAEIYADNTNIIKETRLEDCSQVTLDKNQDQNINAEKNPQIENIKLEPEDIKIESVSPPCTASYRDSKCRIKAELDVSGYLVDKENFNEIIKTFLHKNENVSLVDQNLSEAVKEESLPSSKSNAETNTASSLNFSTHGKKNTENSTVGENNGPVPGVDAKQNYPKKKIVYKSNCLIDEKAFELERARLDREYEKIKTLKKNFKNFTIQSEKDFYIYGDYKHIFEIIIPILREYYPSEFIPDELCYGKILQRLQIDLADAEMCDDEIAYYTRDSVKTMRYLCDHCIVQ